jgi:hypothetical protein
VTEQRQTLPRRDFLRLSLIAGAGISLVLAGGCKLVEQEKSAGNPKNLINGFNYSSWRRGQYQEPASDQSLNNLAASDANSVAICVTGYQETINSTAISRDTDKTCSDEDLQHVIELSKKLGLKVMLKPHIDLPNQGGENWRGTIGKKFNSEKQWQDWFLAYSQFITHYAQLAKETGVDQFCIGTELSSTTQQEKPWREIIKSARQIFSKGQMVYASHFDGEYQNIHFWDALDYIGINAFFPLTDKTNPSVAELKTTWNQKGYMNSIEQVANKYHKNVIFTEVGYRSISRANQKPWEYSNNTEINLEEQANCYKAIQQVFGDKSWFSGIYWWFWEADPNIGGPNDSEYTPFNKPAAKLIKFPMY